jgi:hypothetical protein
MAAWSACGARGRREGGGGCVTSHRGYFSENLETNVVGR